MGAGHVRGATCHNDLMTARTYRYDTTWGEGSITALHDAVVNVRPPGTAHAHLAAPLDDAPESVQQLAQRLALYFDGEPVELVDRATLERWLDAAGIAGFRRTAMLALFDVPYGVTISYGELAEIAGAPRAARAAGTVCATNPLFLVVPCHRVLPASGRLGRYGDLGSSYKQRLLDLEQAGIPLPA